MPRDENDHDLEKDQMSTGRRYDQYLPKKNEIFGVAEEACLFRKETDGAIGDGYNKGATPHLISDVAPTKWAGICMYIKLQRSTRMYRVSDRT